MNYRVWATSVAILWSARVSAGVFVPVNTSELGVGIATCLEKSEGVGNCANGPLGAIGSWDVSAITNMDCMFDMSEASHFNQDLSAWTVSAVTSMKQMFHGAHNFNKDLSTWDVSAVTDMRGMFYRAWSFNQRLAPWQVSAVKCMTQMFYDARYFNQDLSTWDVSSVTDMSEMFYKAQFFNHDISTWDVSKVTSMAKMFRDAEGFNKDLSAWNVSAVTSMTHMFYHALSFEQTLCGAAWIAANASNYVSKHLLFHGSHGSISSTVCTTSTTTTTTTTTASTTTTIATTTIGTTTTTTTTIGTTTRITTTIATSPSTTRIAVVTTSTRTAQQHYNEDATNTTYAIVRDDPTVHVGSFTQWVAGISVGLSVLIMVVAMLMVKRCREKSHRGRSDSKLAIALTSTDSMSLLVRKALPNVAIVPLSQRTFATSNYRWFYAEAQAPAFQYDLLGAVDKMLQLFAARLNPTLEPASIAHGVQSFMRKIQGDAFRNNEELANDVGAVAEYLWTSAKTHDIVKNMELCSVLNAVIRDDVAEEVEAAAMFFRSINSRRVRRADHQTNIDVQSYPPNGETWRGGGFRAEFRDFFTSIKRKKYRVPGFLATSADRKLAVSFAFRADSAHPCAIWRITFDKRGKQQPEYRVRHMAFVSKTLIEGENEYLFAPYSVFKLMSVKWSAELNKPHEFTIQSARDNQEEDEELPLAPWY